MTRWSTTRLPGSAMAVVAAYTQLVASFNGTSADAQAV